MTSLSGSNFISSRIPRTRAWTTACSTASVCPFSSRKIGHRFHRRFDDRDFRWRCRLIARIGAAAHVDRDRGGDEAQCPFCPRHPSVTSSRIEKSPAKQPEVPDSTSIAPRARAIHGVVSWSDKFSIAQTYSLRFGRLVLSRPMPVVVDASRVNMFASPCIRRCVVPRD